MPAPSRLAFVDLETSGLSPGADRITEIGVVTADDGSVEEWTTLVNPGRDLTERSRFYNGITSHELADAPRFGAIAAHLAARLAGRLFVAHNARFDFGFLRAEFRRAGIEFQPLLERAQINHHVFGRLIARLSTFRQCLLDNPLQFGGCVRS